MGKRLISLGAGFFIFSILFGCVTVANKGQNTVFLTTLENSAKPSVYLYREGGFVGGMLSGEVAIDGMKLATIDTKQFAATTVPEGNHDISIYYPVSNHSKRQTFTAKKNEKICFVHSWTGFNNPTIELNRTDCNVAQSEYSSYSLAKDNNSRLYNEIVASTLGSESPMEVGGVNESLESNKQNLQSEESKNLNLGNYYALIIGNNNYKNMPRLESAVADAQAINKALAGKYDFSTQIMQNATRSRIIHALNEYRKMLTPDDNLLIFYAGHGWLDEEADEGYWLPVDASKDDPTNWLSNSTISSTLKAIKARHVLVIADSCYSGKLARGVQMRNDSSIYYSRIASKRNRSVISSGGLEPVFDGGKSSHSVFTQALLDALEENKDIIDATQLFSQIRRRVVLNTEQTPQFADIKNAGHEGGDFLFKKNGSALSN